MVLCQRVVLIMVYIPVNFIHIHIVRDSSIHCAENFLDQLDVIFPINAVTQICFVCREVQVECWHNRWCTGYIESTVQCTPAHFWPPKTKNKRNHITFCVLFQLHLLNTKFLRDKHGVMPRAGVSQLPLPSWAYVNLSWHIYV